MLCSYCRVANALNSKCIRYGCGSLSLIPTWVEFHRFQASTFDSTQIVNLRVRCDTKASGFIKKSAKLMTNSLKNNNVVMVECKEFALSTNFQIP